MLFVSRLTNWLCFFQSETHSLMLIFKCEHLLPKIPDHISEHASRQSSDPYLVLTCTVLRLQLQQQSLLLLQLTHRWNIQYLLAGLNIAHHLVKLLKIFFLAQVEWNSIPNFLRTFSTQVGWPIISVLHSLSRLMVDISRRYGLPQLGHSS